MWVEPQGALEAVTEDKWIVRHVSFAWATGALLAGAKTVTRCDWKDNWARRWKEGDYAFAYDKNPTGGGTQLAIIRLTHTPYKESTADIPAEDWAGEGFAYMSVHGDTVDGTPPRDFWNRWRNEPEDLWVVRFEVVELIPRELDPLTGRHAFAGSQATCETCGFNRESDWHRRGGV
ncbi:hypothetical protein LCGC14_1825200 [marine sediment metagenome]|uniref:ASCH domain-containing protein n=1 Tax=marine sediment metagenome TaxID=412755 RepID=A0A0F9IXD7_9ZZZZ